jgi:hypothetical protein
MTKVFYGIDMYNDLRYYNAYHHIAFSDSWVLIYISNYLKGCSMQDDKDDLGKGPSIFLDQ